MMIGFGSIQQMIDSLKWNRELLGKKRRAKDVQVEQIKSRKSVFAHQNLEDVEARLSENLSRSKTKTKSRRVTSFFLIIFVVSTAIKLTLAIFKEQPTPYCEKSTLFSSSFFAKPDGSELMVEFFPIGIKAAETILKDGRKNGFSSSFYEDGKLFRSAFYHQDTLVEEAFFYKSGRPILNFPNANDKEVHKITLVDNSRNMGIQFHYYDGKIIGKSYFEYEPR